MIDWSPNIAYAVGLITTDGSLSKDGRHIDFTSKDKELVQIYKDCLGSTAKIGTKLNGQKTSMQYRVQMSNVKLYRFLEEIGLHPNKTHTLGVLKIPEKYHPDFLRGCFDGDGTIWYFWDRRWNNSFAYYLTIGAASLGFLEWLKNQNTLLLSVKGSLCKTDKSFYQLRYGKRETHMLFHEMNYKEGLPRLERKHQKAVNIFLLDPYADKMRDICASGGIGRHASLRG